MIQTLYRLRAPIALVLAIVLAGAVTIGASHRHADGGSPLHCHACAVAHAPAVEAPTVVSIAPPPARMAVHVAILPDTPHGAHRLVASSRAPPTV